MCREKGRERKIRVSGREIQSWGRVSGLEGSLAGGLGTVGCSAQALKIHPGAGSTCAAPMCHLSGDTLQCLASTVLLGGARSVASLITSFLLVSVSAGLTRGALWSGQVGSDDRAIALQWQVPL